MSMRVRHTLFFYLRRRSARRHALLLLFDRLWSTGPTNGGLALRRVQSQLCSEYLPTTPVNQRKLHLFCGNSIPSYIA